ncbi:MFS transporter [Microbispora sp. SCL1-1]|uniref:MFS transporter n=1 Tax=unclassified Microbispora TaxID=2614687 RepID=UPI0011594BE8|nr:MULTISPECIES: MFS transporter [unclassified Microbispora]NJP23955.1 MFS transporter [Microbispora sp. CL1-1]TQS15471.1 MFS transporter [Microbispora sp. SCL1-1]
MTEAVARSLWRVRDFRRYAGADAISKLGSEVSLVALPLTAALTLHASPFEVGLLTAAEMVAFLLVGLPAGAWVDRMRRRPVLVAADVVRALALLSIPAAALLGVLGLPQMYAVALVNGLCTVFFDVAHQSYLPSIVGREDLARGHGTLAANQSLAQLSGPGIGGWLVQALTAPIAVVADALSYAGSALLLLGVRADEQPGEKALRDRGVRGGARLWPEIAEGLLFVAGQPVLRRVAAVGALMMLTFGLWSATVPLYMVREVGVSPGTYGMLLSAGAVGGVAGAWLAPRITARVGTGRAMYGSAWAATVCIAPLALTAAGPRLLILPAALAASGVATTVFSVAQGAYRQSICPPHLLGRLSATMRFLMWGPMPLGGLLAGTLGQLAGVRVAFWTACGAYTLAHLPVLLAPRIRAVS